MPIIVKNTTIPGPLDLLLPHSCRGCGRVGEVLCDHCKNYIIKSHINLCPQCKQSLDNGQCQNCPDLPPAYSIGPREGLLDDLIRNFKYNSTRALGPKLAELLDIFLPSNLDNTHIVPLPTSTHHIRTRGLDHTHLVAKHLARLRKYDILPLLVRATNTVQVGADKKARLLQAETAYTINNHLNIDPAATYLLFDDIWTTGASMQTAIKKLRLAGAQNIAIALLAVSLI